MKEEIERLLGAGAVSERPVRDLWPRNLIRERTQGPGPSVLVARPVGADQVAALLGWASSAGVVVVPVGGASGVCGAVDVEAGQLALDLTALNRVLEVDELNLSVRVEAGMLGGDLEEVLNRRGLTLGHQPSSLPVASVGGLVSTRSSGQESTRHGNVEDLVLGLRVALPGGALVDPRPGPRSAVGPALHQLLVGAEGGLGVVVEAVLRVHRLPATTLGRGYEFAAVEPGLEAMREIVQAGLRPLVMRLYDPQDTALQMAGSVQGCLLVVAAAGEPEVAQAEAAVVARLCAGAADLGSEPWERWRRHRYDLSAQRLRDLIEPPGAIVDTIEIAAPWSAMPGAYSEIIAELGRAGIALCHFSHAYPQGCCAYFTFAGSFATEKQALAAYDRAWSTVMAACRRRGATISHHHGVGQARAGWAAEEMGGWWQVWEAVRAALDPAGVMNPRALGGRAARP